MTDKIENSEEKKEDKTSKKSWFKNPYLIILLGILLFTLGLRIYYLSLTADQALWWDESEYASAAKHIVLGTPQWIAPSRMLLFPMIASPFYLIGLGDAGIKLLEIILITASVLLIYLITKKLYDNKIAVLTAALSSVFWVTIFWSVRITTDIPAFFLQLISILFFLKYMEHSKLKDLALTVIFFAFAFFVRTQTFLLIPVFVLFFLAIKRDIILKNKKVLAISGIILAFLIALFLILKNVFSQLFIKPNLDFPIAWNIISYVWAYLNPLLFILMLIGLISFLDLFIGFDTLKNSKKLKSDLFILLIFVVWYAFLMFYIRSGEDRWLLMTSLPIFIAISKGLVIIYDFIKKYSKAIAVLVVGILLISGAYFELSHADSLIKIKKDSYLQVKESGLWMKENSNKSDIIISASQPQHTYYSERSTSSEYIGEGDEENFNTLIAKLKPRYLVLSVFQPMPKWIYDWPQRHNETVQPVKVYYLDEEQQQLALVIYEFLQK